MKQFFILGRNPELSKEEIFAYSRTNKIEISEELIEENILVLETKKEILIQELGGTVKSGTISFEGNEKDLEEYLRKNEIIPSDKFSYSVYGNIEPSILKEKFKRERKKSILKHGRQGIRLQNGERVQNTNADFHILLTKKEGNILLGLVNQEYDYEDIKSRDMKKPVRREALTISPRLSKILINLSETKKGEKLLDPFCGVGSIISEALIKKINSHGIDKDPKAIKDAEKNIRWLKKNFKISERYSLETKDSKFAKNLQFDGIATETPLGILLKKKPNRNLEKKIIQDFEAMIIPILSRLKKIKRNHAKIAITFPRFEETRVNIKKITSRTSLSLKSGPFQESRPKQLISREIIVFE